MAKTKIVFGILSALALAMVMTGAVSVSVRKNSNPEGQPDVSPVGNPTLRCATEGQQCSPDANPCCDGLTCADIDFTCIHQKRDNKTTTFTTP